MSNEPRQRLLLVVAALVVGVLLTDRMLLTPLTRVWKERADRIAELRQSVSQGSLLLDREEAIESRWDSMRTNSLPSDPSAAESIILRSFERWSQESRISLSSVKPVWIPVDEKYMTLECRADGFGSIDGITRFLYELEKDPLAFKVQSMSITAKDKEGSQLALAVQLSGLVLASP